MEVSTYFKELFAYNLDANKNVIALILENRHLVSAKIVQLINHVLNAQQIWNERILNQNSNCKVWEIRDIDQLISINQLNYEQSLTILNGLNLDQTLSYTTSNGISFTNTIRDILFHVINHSTYHRAQIASELSNNKITPVNSDFIFYKRN